MFQENAEAFKNKKNKYNNPETDARFIYSFYYPLGMHTTEYAILKHMEKNPSKDISTSELVNNIFKDETHHIDEQMKMDFKDKDEIRKVKQLKAKLHRNILYHLNRLISDDLITVTKQGNKGEKFI